jgi:hypothetical protein
MGVVPVRMCKSQPGASGSEFPKEFERHPQRKNRVLGSNPQEPCRTVASAVHLLNVTNRRQACQTGMRLV